MTQNHALPRRWIWPVALVLVTLLALGLRWYYVSTAMVIHPIRGDAIQYFSYAWNLAHHGVFAGNPPGSAVLTPSNYRDPGYPLLLAAWMKLLGTDAYWYAAVLLCQALLGALTVTCAMQLGRRWLSWPWATAAGVLMAVWPHNITIASDLLTETLFGFLCALAMLLCARACDRRSTLWTVLAGLCFGAAALTNAVLLPFGIMLALYLALRRHIPRRLCLTLIAACALLPAIWAIRNSQLPPMPPGHSTTGRALQNLVQGSWPDYHSAYIRMVAGDKQGNHILAAINHETVLLQTTPSEGASIILHRLEQNPWHYLAWYTLKKPWLLWDWRIRMGQNDIYVYPTAHSPFHTQPVMRALVAICHTINPALAVLALACLILVLLRRLPLDKSRQSRSSIESVLALLVFATLVYTALQSEPRYSIPFRSFEMLLAMTTCCALVRWLQTRVEASRQREPTLGQTPPA